MSCVWHHCVLKNSDLWRWLSSGWQGCYLKPRNSGTQSSPAEKDFCTTHILTGIYTTVFNLITAPPLFLAIFSLTGAQIYISLPWIARLPTGLWSVCVTRVTVYKGAKFTRSLMTIIHPRCVDLYIHRHCFTLLQWLLYACCFLSMAGSVGDLDLREEGGRGRMFTMLWFLLGSLRVNWSKWQIITPHSLVIFSPRLWKFQSRLVQVLGWMQ